MTAQPDMVPALGVVAVSGVEYAQTLIKALEAGQVTVPLRDAQDSDRIARGHVDKVITPAPEGGWLDMPFSAPADDCLAMISFTSGTEGVPKAVHLSRGNLAHVVSRLNAVMAVTDEIREYVGVPVTHSFGYGRVRAVLAAGGRAFLPEGGFDLREIRKMLRAGEINAISAVPSLWRVFLQERALFGDELQAVRWVEIGSQHMSAEDKLALRKALPNARIVQHYGLTEASRSTLLRIDEATPDRLASVGRAEGDVAVKITADGRIAVRGPHLALGVEDGTDYRALGPDAWFQTSDLGRLEDGYVYYEGRADDVINCGGIKLSPDLIEAHLRDSLPATGDFGVLRRPDPMWGDGIALALGPSALAHADALLAETRAYAAARGVNAGGAIRPVEVDDLPRTATGKLQRKLLSATLAADPAPAAPPAAPEDFMRFAEGLLGDAARAPGAIFQDLGGDSLSHMQMVLMLERALGTVPANWEYQPLKDLAAQVDAAGDVAALLQAPSGAPPLPDGSRNENPKGISFRALVAEDFHTNDASIFHQGFLMLLVHRFGNWRMDVRPRLLRAPLTLLYRFFNKLTQLFFGMKLDYTVKVGRRVKLEHFGGMILGAREIGDDVILRQNTTLGIRSVDDLKAKPVIGAHVDVGAGAVIVGNITIGENAIIGANSVVFSNVPPDAVVMGVPARVIGTNPRRNPSPLKGR